MEGAPARIRGSFKAQRQALGLFEIDMTGKRNPSYFGLFEKKLDLTY